VVPSATQKLLLRFGAFELNLESEELLKSGLPVKLPPQPLKLLALLAGHASQVVTRDQIQQELWAGETFVDFDHGVNKCINQIRTVLGDNADHPLYIETLPRRGYRFVAPVTSQAIAAPQPRIIPADLGGPSRFATPSGAATAAATATAAAAAGVDQRYDVFISYRRGQAAAEARLIRAELVQHGLRVFLDVTDLGTGYFDDSLLERIANAPNFLLVLSPRSLDRCIDEEDWFRRELAHAIRCQCNIVPVLLPGFKFPKELPEDIASLRRHQAVEYSHTFFEATSSKVRGMIQAKPDPAAAQDVVGNRSETGAASAVKLSSIPDVVPATKARSRALPASIAVAALLVAVGGGLFWRSRAHKPPTLTDKDTVVVADFDNKTGDPVFNDALKQGLAIQLEQSPFLKLISQGKVNQTLKLMGRHADDVLTPEVAREVCQRAGSKAMVTGSIDQLGNQYVIGLKALNCETADVLAEAQEQAASKESVIRALGVVAASLRTRLGESLKSVQEYSTPLEETTTPSLEALQASSLGQKIEDEKGDTAALPFFKRAVELDPKFAAAYTALSGAYFNLGEMGLAAENARKAYELREKVSERERFAIEANYYMLVTGELEKVAQVYEMLQQSYPRDDNVYLNSSAIYSWLGNWEKALGQASEAMRLEPNEGMNYDNLGTAYTSLNQLNQAEAVYKEAEKRKLEDEDLLLNRYQLAFLEGDPARMAQVASAAMGKPGAEDLLLGAQADTDAWYGKLSEAGELTRRAIDSAARNDAKETAAGYQAAAALREAEFGKWEQARANAEAAMRLAPNRDVRAMATLALARAGDTARAETLAAELDRTFPQGTLVQRYWLPAIEAAIALQRKDPKHAVERLSVASSIELGQPLSGVAIALCPAYLRGEAYLALGDGKSAAAEFQKFLDHRGLAVNFSWAALARLGLARAYALEGDTAKARAAYQGFLTLWKDADSDIPIYQQAKTEYAKLR